MSCIVLLASTMPLFVEWINDWMNEGRMLRRNESIWLQDGIILRTNRKLCIIFYGLFLENEYQMGSHNAQLYQRWRIYSLSFRSQFNIAQRDHKQIVIFFLVVEIVKAMLTVGKHTTYPITFIPMKNDWKYWPASIRRGQKPIDLKNVIFFFHCCFLGFSLVVFLGSM